MHRSRLLLAIVLILIGVSSLALWLSLSAPARTTPSPTPLLLQPTPTPFPTLPSSPSATAGNNPQPTPSTPSRFEVRFHPDGGLYVGDLISVEVIAPAEADLHQSSAMLTLPTAEGPRTLERAFAPQGIGGRMQATFSWVWDTHGLPPGEHQVGVAIPDLRLNWVETVTLKSAAELPPTETQARWALAESRCCRILYLTHTKAELDIDQIKEMADEQSSRASQRLGVTLTEPITITLLPRVLGHGGFASDQGIALSYLERDYVVGDKATILHHEFVHMFDSRRKGEWRPSLFVEGLAVYLSEGHYRQEPLMARAAALLPTPGECHPWDEGGAEATFIQRDERPLCGLDRYIPFTRLLENFYLEQHEIGYLQAGALVAYLVDTWGWKRFLAFYGDIRPPRETPPEIMRRNSPNILAVDLALQRHYGLNLPQLEHAFRQALRRQVLTPPTVLDLALTVAYYDTVRRYQQMLDPSAYFLSAWLVDLRQMRLQGITADYLRHPSQVENLALETMLIAAGETLFTGDFSQTYRYLQAINAVLDDYPIQGMKAFTAHPLAQTHLNLVRIALSHGYEPQRLRLGDNQARLWVTQSTPLVQELTLIYNGEEWVIVSASGELPFLPPLAWPASTVGSSTASH